MLSIAIGLDPVAFSLGPIAVHWYGIGYVVAIAFGLWVITKYAPTRGVTEDQLSSVTFWAIIAGFIGGRLYYVVQNNFTSYLTHPGRVFQVWNGGMAFFGAIIAVALVVLIFAIKNRWKLAPMLDVAAMFALMGQPIGRLGNVVNGDIIGEPTHVAWGFIYSNPNSFAPSTTVAYHPAAIYEIICNLVLIALLFPLRKRLAHGWFFAAYLAGYCLSQLIVFAWRTEPVVGFGLRQAQVTAIVILVAEAAFLAFWLARGRRPWQTTAARPSPEVA